MSDAIFPSGAVREGTALYTALWPQREAMAARWAGIVNGTYPFQTPGFVRTSNDRFANPVGYRTEDAAHTVVAVLFTEQPEQEALLQSVEELIRVRAVQDFSPEAAVGIVFALKDIVYETAVEAGLPKASLADLLGPERRIDALALMAFGVYARCRETLHQMKLDSFMRRNSQLLRMAERKAARADDTETPNR